MTHLRVMFNSAPPTATAVAPAPSREDPAVAEAARRQAASAKRRKGLVSTILNGAEGVTGPAPVAHKTLLGQ